MRRMRKRRTALLAATIAIAFGITMTTSACESGSGDSSAGGDAATFSTQPTGALSAWAFDNADEVGKARIGYAAKQLSGVTIKMDQTAFDAQKFTTRLAAGDVPDVV